jgi:hypothetical protein
MKSPSRRVILAWGLRLLLGMAVGWGVRLLYERRPMMRFATGLAVRSVNGPETSAARGSHLRDGQPHFFSLDQIMAADDPAAALRSWREAFQRAAKEIQQQALQARAEVSVGALRRLIVQLSTSADLREEMNSLLGVARDLGADLYNPDAALRSLLELARLDPGLALDGAKAIENEHAEAMIWALIAEDDPRRVIDLVQAGQAPAGALSAAVASLAARDFKEAEAVIRSLPDDQQNHLQTQLADTLARTRPLEALALRTDANNIPDPAWAMKIIRHVPGPLAIDFLLGLEREHPALLQSCTECVPVLLQRQAQREPGFVFEWLERRDPAEWNTSAHLVAALSPHDPARAAALVQRLEEKASAPSQVAAAKSDILSTWMRRDPTAAMQWLVDQPNASAWMQGPDPHSSWTHSIPVRPEQSASLVRWLDERGVLTRPDFQAAGALVQPWIQHDPAAAVAWAASLPEGGARSVAVTEAASALSQSRMPDRQAHLDTLLRSAPDALGAVIHGVHGVDPAFLPLGDLVAKELPRLLPPGDLPSWGLTSHLAASLDDPASRQNTLQAVAALPDPSQRQQLLEAMATHQTQPNRKPPLRLTRQLANAMPDPDAARRFLENDLRDRLQR